MRRAPVVALVGAAVLLGATGTVVAVAGHRASPARTAGDPGVGALFLNGSHYCSASVVDSAHGDELLTAAHCLHGGSGGAYLTGITFAPGFHDGVAPFGFWAVGDELVSPGWADDSDPDLDVGFATAHHGTARIEDVTGANRLGTNGPFTRPVTVTGYADGSDTPAVCARTTSRQDTYQLRVDCPGFATGTSGGPWVTKADPRTKLGTVVGVIGGFQTGGDTDDVSYSSYFDDDVATLYRQATSRP
ncbi:serine protease [Amycolatopsis sp. FDAARGOS 1241]|uniref:trypsin-like serine peptidase n=1 Tax=Amycolatopsis sp. FDAARGOS 1241 TaxID=2778070 RepID=UPI00194F98C8|nr:serine protease [Amycolatopsis sp. FDAARGOS 1241]QRP45813.1 serine protease [Amycolatopsis sp. FDAARGOS 1241]